MKYPLTILFCLILGGCYAQISLDPPPAGAIPYLQRPAKKQLLFWYVTTQTADTIKQQSIRDSLSGYTEDYVNGGTRLLNWLKGTHTGITNTQAAAALLILQ